MIADEFLIDSIFPTLNFLGISLVLIANLIIKSDAHNSYTLSATLFHFKYCRKFYGSCRFKGNNFYGWEASIPHQIDFWQQQLHAFITLSSLLGLRFFSFLKSF